MNAIHIGDAIGMIDEELIIPVMEKRIKQQNAERRRIRAAAAAAAACVCVTAAALILPELMREPAAPPAVSAPEAELPDADRSAAAPVGNGSGSAEKQAFDDVISGSYAFVFARCTGTASYSDGRNGCSFETVTHLAGGEMPEEFIVSFPGAGYAPQIKEGSYYILPVCKSISVFFDEYERYYLASGTLLETDDSGNILSSELQGNDVDIGISNVSEFTPLFANTEAICNQSGSDIGTKYSAADDLEGVCRDSDYILEVEAVGVNTDFAEDRTSYDCRVLSVYKAADDTDEIIDVTTAKSAMEVGRKYIIAVNRVSEESDIFIISSRSRSVYPAGSPEAEEMIRLSG